MYSFEDNKSIIIKGADKVAAVIIWDREDYLKETYKQLEDKEVYWKFRTTRVHLWAIFLSLLKK